MDRRTSHQKERFDGGRHAGRVFEFDLCVLARV